MKTTLKVTINGIAFTIDEDAYRILDNYLCTLKSHFDKKNEGKEIVDDIEARLSELLLMRINSHTQVISIDDAKEIIKIMGNPTDLFEEDGNTKNVEPNTPPIVINKKLYRSRSNRVIAGVCGGLGYYFNLDPVIFRLLFIVLSVGIVFIPSLSIFNFFPLKNLAVWTYVILWIAVPQAKTPKQKLEMEGNNPSIDEIEKRVLDEQKNYKPKQAYKNKSSWGRVNFIATIIRFFSIFIVGIILLIVTVILISIIASILGFTYYTNVGFNDILGVIGVNSLFFSVLLSTVVLYPLLVVVYLCTKIIFKFKVRDKNIMILGFIIWFISLIVFSGYTISQASQFFKTRKSKFEKYQHVEVLTNHDTLYINLPEEYQKSADEAIGELKSNNDFSP